jgi:hypothetical protein
MHHLTAPVPVVSRPYVPRLERRFGYPRASSAVQEDGYAVVGI